MHDFTRMPTPDVYEGEYDFWPWGLVLSKLTESVIRDAPQDAVVVDYMCGTGRLLHMVSKNRPDLVLCGCDISNDYINYGKTRYPGICLEQGDALAYRPSHRPAVAVCSAGIHHLDPAAQSLFVQKVANELTAEGLFFIGEEVIRNWSNEPQRQMAILELDTALLEHLIATSAPPRQIEAAIDMLKRDLLKIGEFKSSLEDLLRLLQSCFRVTQVTRVWPGDDRPFGDYLLHAQRGGTILP